MIDKILFITLSNIGDVILTLPALDCLKANFPQAKVTVMAGPRTAEIFKDNSALEKLIVYDKHIKLREKIRLFYELKREGFDLVADLRNSLFGVFIPARYKISPFLFIPKNIKHMKERHLFKIKQLISKIAEKDTGHVPGVSLSIRAEDEGYVSVLLKTNNINSGDNIVVVSPGGRSHIKRWHKERFVQLINRLIDEFSAKVVLIGDKDDLPTAQYITENSEYPILNLSAMTNLLQLGALLKKADLIITNDSATLHLSSYLNRKIIAVFGSTDERKYCPWSDNWAIVKKEIFCRPCREAQCKSGALECMRLVKVEDVLVQVRNMLVTSGQLPVTSVKKDFKRILIARTDRIGDVILSTPVIKAMRQAYPHAYIAMLVSPYTKDIVEGNPYLDEVLVLDKDVRHKSWLGFLKFSFLLRRKRFDLAIILHPASRVHLLAFSAGIRRRIGYDYKLGFLLTDRLRHTKQLGQRHEAEYNLDLLKILGIEAKDKNLFIPLKEAAEKWAEDLFKRQGIKPSDKLLVIHPGASCVSKIWPAERFAETTDKLAEKYGFKILVIAGPRDIAVAEKVAANIRYPLINLAGKTSVAQLASLLKRCRLFISNDSGPVHIACAVGTPVISIFGRAQKGLSPMRWGPLGLKSKFLHKPAGCIECLAHNCVKEFACLKAITVADVLHAAEEILS